MLQREGDRTAVPIALLGLYDPPPPLSVVMVCLLCLQTGWTVATDEGGRGRLTSEYTSRAERRSARILIARDYNCQIAYLGRPGEVFGFGPRRRSRAKNSLTA